MEYINKYIFIFLIEYNLLDCFYLICYNICTPFSPTTLHFIGYTNTTKAATLLSSSDNELTLRRCSCGWSGKSQKYIHITDHHDDQIRAKYLKCCKQSQNYIYNVLNNTYTPRVPLSLG